MACGDTFSRTGAPERASYTSTAPYRRAADGEISADLLAVLPAGLLSEGRRAACVIAPPSQSGPKTECCLRILIADDERVIAESLATIFRAKGMDAMAVYSGESALETAESFQPDVLLCDVMLGKMNGIDVGIAMTERFPSCRIVLFSGQAATSNLIANANAKGYHFEILSKPIHPEVLLKHIGKLHRQKS